MANQRYVVSPYSYYGGSSRPRSWGVWDTIEKEWAWSVGSKQEAQDEADLLNCKFFECPECDNVQVEESTVDVIKCERCDQMYYPA